MATDTLFLPGLMFGFLLGVMFSVIALWGYVHQTSRSRVREY